MLRVGITGGIGSGKTTVCQHFEELGVPVYYADVRAKQLMEENPQLRHSIVNLFGNQAYLDDNSLHREYIASVVFNHKEKLQQLNSLVHPVVAADAECWNQIWEKKGAPYSLREAALLIESGMYKFLDKLIVVTAPEEERIQRVMARDHMTREQVIARIRTQMPESEKVKLADFVIENIDAGSLLLQVKNIHEQLLKQAQP
jgi:dephospho-CoA kinase